MTTVAYTSNPSQWGDGAAAASTSRRPADVIVTMGCVDACPAGKELSGVRAICDDIGARVRALVDEFISNGDG